MFWVLMLITTGAGLAEAMLQLVLAVPAGVPVESATLAVKGNVPLSMGMPVMPPVVLFSDSTSGKEPAVME